MIINLVQIMVFFLIFARFLGLFMMAPIFSRKEINTLTRVAMIFWISAIFLLIVPTPPAAPETPIGYIIMMLMEFLLGAMIGFVMDLIMTGIEFAGSLMDTQAGLSVAALLNPGTGRQETIISILLKWTSVVIFLIIDGHHLVLSSLVQSFYILPLGHAPNMGEASKYIAGLGTYIFFIALKLSSPIILVVFLVDFGMGILNKVAEQVNVFQLGFQVKPVVSLIIFLAISTGLVHSIMAILERTSEEVITVFKILQV